MPGRLVKSWRSAGVRTLKSAQSRVGFAVERGRRPPLVFDADGREVEWLIGPAVGVGGGVVDLQGVLRAAAIDEGQRIVLVESGSARKDGRLHHREERNLGEQLLAERAFE